MCVRNRRTADSEAKNLLAKAFPCPDKSKGSKLASVGIDDSMRIFDQNTSTYEAGNATKLKAQPRGIDHKGDLTVVVTRNSIVMVIFFFEI